MEGHIVHPAQLVAFSPEKLNKVNLYESHRLFCDVYCLNPGQSQKPHTHDANDKLYYGLTGTCHVQLGDDEHELAPGGLAVAPAGVVHGVSNRGAEPATLLVVMAPHPKPA